MTKIIFISVVALLLGFMLITCGCTGSPSGPSTGQIENAVLDYCGQSTWVCGGDAQMVEVIQVGESYMVGEDGLRMWPVRIDILIKKHGWKSYECDLYKNQFDEWTVWFFAER